jgi:acetyl-CoA decarbonylase/synthase complex subunit delta
MEYSYSVMERIRMAAITQEDDKLQAPLINNIGNEIWKCKEAGQPLDDAPTLGDPEKRPILMEAVAGVCYLLAGSDTVILRHPESVRLVRSFIDLMINGGTAQDVQAISKNLEEQEVDLAALAPEPDLSIETEEAPAKAAKPKKEEKPKAAPKAEEKVAEAKPKAEEKPKPKPKAEAKPKEEAGKKAEAKADAEAKAEAEEEAKKKAEEEAKAKAEAEAKAKAEAEAKAKAEAEAKAKAEAEAEKKAAKEAKAKEKEELQALRQKRAEEREKREAERTAAEGEEVSKTPAGEQLDLVEKLTMNLRRIHKRG